MAVFILYDNKWSLGACSASGTDVNYSPDSTRNPLRVLPWRSNTVTASAWLRCDLGAAQSITTLAIASPVVSGVTGTFKLQWSSDNTNWNDVAGVSWAHSLTVGRGNLWLFTFASQSARYWRIFFTFASGSGYIEIGHVFLGPRFSPSYNINAGIQLNRDDNSSLTRSASGSVSRSSRNKQVRFQAFFEQMPNADVLLFRAMWAATGKGVHLYLILDDTNTEYQWYGYFMSFVEDDKVLDEWDINMDFEEAVSA